MDTTSTKKIAIIDGKVFFSGKQSDVIKKSKDIFSTPIPVSTLSKFLSGKKKNIYMSTIFKICVALDCTPNDLFDIEKWKEAELYQDLDNKDIEELW